LEIASKYINFTVFLPERRIHVPFRKRTVDRELTGSVSPAHHDGMLHPDRSKAHPSSVSSSGADSESGAGNRQPTPPYALQDMVRTCNEAGVHATACTAAFIANNRQDILTESAAFMESLADIWHLHGLDDVEVWTEILRRIEVGELFHRLNQPPHRKRREGRIPRPWRISTSKLP
jgi:hypothetical protein